LKKLCPDSDKEHKHYTMEDGRLEPENDGLEDDVPFQLVQLGDF